MLNIDLMRVKPLRGPLKRGDADELQKALKDAGIAKNVTYDAVDAAKDVVVQVYNDILALFQK